MIAFETFTGPSSWQLFVHARESMTKQICITQCFVTSHIVPEYV